jgi:pilus assembly protein CpaC
MKEPAKARRSRFFGPVRGAAFWAALFVSSLVLPARAADREKLTVVVGQSVTHSVPSRIESVSIADSKVADVVVANPHEFLVNGKAIGITTVVVWDENQTRTYDVVVRGPFSDRQIELNVKVAELNRTKALELGFDFLVRDYDNTRIAGVYGGQVTTPNIPFPIIPPQATPKDDHPPEGQATPGVTMALRYLHDGGDFSSMIHTLQTRGVIRMLAEPKLVAASGQSASFLAGGEIPVPVASGGTQGGTSITIYWKEFGVGIKFVPTIVDSGVINLVVAPEVSSLDYSNAIVLSGFSVPALRKRRAETSVEMKDGETLVIGGLMLDETSKQVRKIPILGSVPLLGVFFRNSQDIDTESELLFIVTAHVIHALPKGTEVPLPGVDKRAE